MRGGYRWTVISSNKLPALKYENQGRYKDAQGKSKFQGAAGLKESGQGS